MSSGTETVSVPTEAILDGLCLLSLRVVFVPVDDDDLEFAPTDLFVLLTWLLCLTSASFVADLGGFVFASVPNDKEAFAELFVSLEDDREGFGFGLESTDTFEEDAGLEVFDL